jgi:hypothetical protein
LQRDSPICLQKIVKWDRGADVARLDKREKVSRKGVGQRQAKMSIQKLKEIAIGRQIGRIT